MLTLNLEALGVSEAALERTILSQLGMSREQAVKALADKFGVSLTSEAKPVQGGDTVKTVDGDTKAAILTPEEQRTLARAGEILNRKLNG